MESAKRLLLRLTLDNYIGKAVCVVMKVQFLKTSNFTTNISKVYTIFINLTPHRTVAVFVLLFFIFPINLCISSCTDNFITSYNLAQ